MSASKAPFLILGAIIVFQVCLCLAGLITSYGQADEYTDMNIGWRLSQGEQLYEDIFTKRPPLLHVLLSTLPRLSHNPIDQFYLGRLVFFLAGIITAYCVFVIARQLHSSQAGLLAVFLMVSSPSYSMSFLIRPDVVATTMFLAGLALLFRGKFSMTSTLAAGLMAGLAMVITQKSLYFTLNILVLVALEPFLVSKAGRRGLASAAAKAVMAGMAASVPFIVFLVWAYGAGILDRAVELTITHAYYRGMQFEGFQKISQHYMLLTLQNEILVIPLGIVGVVYALKRARLAGAAPMALMGVSAVISILLFINHGSKWSYFFWTIAPSLSVMGGIFLAEATANLKEAKPIVSWLGLSPAIYFVIVNAAVDIEQLENPIKELQNATMAQMEKITTEQDAVFSGIGFPHNRKRCYPYEELHVGFLDEYSQGLWPRIIPTLRENQCGYFINNFGLMSLPDEERNFLSNNYLRLWGEIYVAGRVFNSHEFTEGPVMFEIIKPGEYAVLGGEGGGVSIDGVPVKGGVVSMAAGSHMISASPEGKGIMLVYRIKAKAPLSEDPGSFPLFAGGAFSQRRIADVGEKLLDTQDTR